MKKNTNFSTNLVAIQIHSGTLETHLRDTLSKLAPVKRPAIVIDPFFQKSPLLDCVFACFTGAASDLPETVVIPPAEPTLGSIAAVRDQLATIAPDVIVVLGGGSAIDTAKIARMSLSNANALGEISGPNVSMAPHPSTFITIPSTAGTGSEVTEVAVASSEDGSYKLPFRSEHMAASIAILDPSVGYSAPMSIRAASGYDAVTHAVEAYISRLANPITDSLALSALRALVTHLPKACGAEPAIDSFQHCLVAASMAGLAFNSAQLGLAHAISSPLGGGEWKIPHGLANALCLPSVMRFNASATAPKERVLADILSSASAAEGLEALKNELGLSQRLGDWLKSDSDIRILAEGSMKSGQIKNNPRSVTLSDVELVIHDAL